MKSILSTIAVLAQNAAPDAVQDVVQDVAQDVAQNAVQGGGHSHYIVIAVAAVVGCALCVLLFRWLSGSDRKTSEAFAADVIHSVADAIKKDLDCSEQEVEQAVACQLMGQPTPVKTGLLNVNCTLEKISASECRRTLKIYTSVGTKYKCYTVEDQVAWEDLPATERNHFLTTGEKKVSYDIYNH